MKKVILGLLLVGLLAPSTGFALTPVVSLSCGVGDLFDRYTGKPCASTSTTIPGCLPGYNFSPMTGQKCVGGVVPQACYVFNRDLTVGSSGADVEKLHALLVREGVISNPYNNPAAGAPNTTNFTELFAAGVVKLQAKYGIIQTGYFGPLTRAKVNGLGCESKPLSETEKKSILDNLSEARLKADDAKIKTNLAYSRTAAEVYYSDNSTGGYGPSASSCSAAMFGTAEFAEYLSGIKEFGGTELTCVSKVDSYAVSVKLNQGYYWCVDSAGFNNTNAKAKVVGSDAKCVVGN